MLWEERESTNPDPIKCGLTGSIPSSTRGQGRPEWSAFQNGKPEPPFISHFLSVAATGERQLFSALTNPHQAITLLACSHQTKPPSPRCGHQCQGMRHPGKPLSPLNKRLSLEKRPVHVGLPLLPLPQDNAHCWRSSLRITVSPFSPGLR